MLHPKCGLFSYNSLLSVSSSERVLLIMVLLTSFINCSLGFPFLSCPRNSTPVSFLRFYFFSFSSNVQTILYSINLIILCWTLISSLIFRLPNFSLLHYLAALLQTYISVDNNSFSWCLLMFTPLWHVT